MPLVPQTQLHAARSPAAPPAVSAGMAAIVGIPILLLLLFVWQLVSPLLRAPSVREPASIARISLEPDPSGARIDFVVVDRTGQETTADGELSITLREPDGAVWHATRSLTAADFAPLPAGGLNAGRLGYTIDVPTSDWVRPPRHGGAATVGVRIQLSGGGTLDGVEEMPFP